MLNADLHMHSRWSDGSLDVEHLVQLAVNRGLDVISITDHDTMKGQDEVRQVGKQLGIQVISGVEISAFNPETACRVHILGYLINDEKKINDVLEPYLLKRHQRTIEAIHKIEKQGYPINEEIVKGYVGCGQILYKQHIMHALVDRGFGTAIYGGLYKHLFGKGGIAHMEGEYIDGIEAVRLINEAGGVAVLAHPFQYDSMAYLPKLKEAGLGGIEYLHPTQNPKREVEVIEAAAKYGLCLTGGSDFHGFYSEKSHSLGDFNFRMSKDHKLLNKELGSCGCIRNEMALF